MTKVLSAKRDFFGNPLTIAPDSYRTVGVGETGWLKRSHMRTFDQNFTTGKQLWNSDLERLMVNQNKNLDKANKHFASYNVPMPNTATFASNLQEESQIRLLNESQYSNTVNLASLGMKETKIGYSSDNWKARLPLKLAEAEKKTNSSPSVKKVYVSNVGTQTTQNPVELIPRAPSTATGAARSNDVRGEYDDAPRVGINSDVLNQIRSYVPEKEVVVVDYKNITAKKLQQVLKEDNKPASGRKKALYERAVQHGLVQKATK